MKMHFRRADKPASISDSDWQSWGWQLRASLKSLSDFEKHFELTSEERAAFQEGSEVFNIRTTPYYASLARPVSMDPIRKIMMPNALELAPAAQSMLDPLGERK
ncbi:MAG: KamA family radical SAM protein, partial [Proteobacteria bacterium]